MPEHEVEAVEQIMGFPDKGMRAEIGQRVKGQRRPKTPPASELAEFAGWSFSAAGSMTLEFETFMFYEKSRVSGAVKKATAYEYKHCARSLCP